jgi:uncharacterized membrane protein YgcG
MKNKSSFLLVILLFTVIAPVNSFSAEAFVIDAYMVDINVMENNSYKITEVIDVEFIEQRHGINRDIPLQFNGSPVKISHITVPGYESKVTISQDAAHIRIGSPDVFVDGDVRYIVSYTYDVGVDDSTSMDEFYHNIIGTQWDTSIAAAFFKVVMPKPFNSEDVNFTSGPLGSTDNSNVRWSVSGTTIIGEIVRPLHSHEALTIALPLPEGYWVDARDHSTQDYKTESGPASINFYKTPDLSRFYIVGYPAYVFSIIFAAIFWYRNGRDRKLVPAVEFEPPEGLIPAELGYILDGHADDKDVTSLIIYWAEKGFLRIYEARTNLVFTKVKELGEDAKSYEKTLFERLFSYGDGKSVSVQDLANKFYKDIQKTRGEIVSSFNSDPERRIYLKVRKRVVALFVFLASLPVISVVLETLWIANWPLFLSVLSFVYMLPVMLAGWLIGSVINRRSYVYGWLPIFLLLFFSTIGAFLFLFVFTVSSTGTISLWKLSSALISAVIVVTFLPLMTRRTEYGDEMLTKILGFKKFIKTAEMDKLEALFESDPEYFFKILPYALVMGLSRKWSTHFKRMAMWPPDWYQGNDRRGFNSMSFNYSLHRSFNIMNTVMNSYSSSNGSQSSLSGGSSGGGSGGGGGSSW